ncbi:MAG TPA: transposase [Candidatus Obscuribacterales bacterium]
MELTPQTVHSGVVEAQKFAENEVNLKIQTTPPAQKLQHTLRAGFGKVIKASFGDRQQTKIGGAPLLAELELTMQLVAGAAACLRDWRAPGQIDFRLYHLLWQRVLLICCGYEDVIDAQFLSHDPGLWLSLIGDEDQRPHPGIASQPTVCRFENSFGKANCYRLAAWLLYAYIAGHKSLPESITLHFDGSCIPTYGNQQGTSFRSYYDENMYFPLFVFDQDGVLITAVLRPGHHGEAKLVVPILKRLARAFHTAWPNVRIKTIMDSAFSDPAIYDWCEDNNVFYLIKLRNSGGKGSGLFSHSNDMAGDCKQSFGSRFGTAKYLNPKKKKCEIEKELRQEKDKKKRKKNLKELAERVVRRYGEFHYQAGKGGKDKKQWRRPRRILAECIYDDWGPRRTFWVTNIVGEEPAHLINKVYSPRGEAELRIKDAKEFRCDKLSCQQFVANQFRLLMHVLAQRLLQAFRRLLPPAAQRMSLASIREHFIRIPGIVQVKARDTELSWPSAFPFKKQMHALCQRLTSAAVIARDWIAVFNAFIKPLTIRIQYAA